MTPHLLQAEIISQKRIVSHFVCLKVAEVREIPRLQNIVPE